MASDFLANVEFSPSRGQPKKNQNPGDHQFYFLNPPKNGVKSIAQLIQPQKHVQYSQNFLENAKNWPK